MTTSIKQVIKSSKTPLWLGKDCEKDSHQAAVVTLKGKYWSDFALRKEGGETETNHPESLMGSHSMLLTPVFYIAKWIFLQASSRPAHLPTISENKLQIHSRQHEVPLSNNSEVSLFVYFM